MKKLYVLQGLRAVAFFCVFLGHAGILEIAGVAVSIFFVLSGFLMTYNYYYRDPLSNELKSCFIFATKKIKKLYPLHIIMMCPMVLLTLWGMRTEFSLLGISKVLLPNILLIQSWFPNKEIYFGLNGVSWYLSTSMFLYFAFPFILNKIQASWSKKKAYICISVTFILQVVLAIMLWIANLKVISFNFAWFTYVFPLYRVGDFFIGCNAGYLFLKKQSESTFAYATLREVLAITLMCTAVLIPKNKLLFESTSLSAIYIPGSVALVYVFAEGRGMISKILESQVFVIVGNMSAYLYLIHQVVINYVEIFLNHKFMVAIVSFVMTLILARMCQKFERSVIMGMGSRCQMQ